MSEEKKAEPAGEWLSVDELEDVQNKSWCLENCAYNLNALLARKANGATSLEEFERRVRQDEREKMIKESYAGKAGADYVNDYEAMKSQLTAKDARIKELEAKLAHVEKYYTV